MAYVDDIETIKKEVTEVKTLLTEFLTSITVKPAPSPEPPTPAQVAGVPAR